MKPPAFDYVRVGSLAEAADVLGDEGDQARVMAGGQSLMAMLNMRLTEPKVIVDIATARESAYIRQTGDFVSIGAGTTQAELEAWPDLGSAVPLLQMVLPPIGHIQTRSRGTVCGSLCHADPSSELPLVLATLAGEVSLLSSRGERTMAADDFQIGMLVTRRQPDEVMSEARFPLARSGQRFGFREVARRRGDYAIVALACVVDDSGIRLGVGGVADRPTVRQWSDLEESDLADALNDFAWELEGYDDIHASARYRRELVRRIGSDLIRETALWNG